MTRSRRRRRLCAVVAATLLTLLLATAKEVYNGRVTTARRRNLYQQSLHDHYSAMARALPNRTAMLPLLQRAFADLIYPEVQRRSMADSLPDRAHSLHHAFPPFPESKRQANLRLLEDMFQHAYDSYLYQAFPAGEVHPLSCQPGRFDLIRLPALTLIDALDTLVIMGNFTEFARALERLRVLHNEQPLFDRSENVNVFETNIRVLGGLLSAHQLAIAYLSNQVAIDDVLDRDGHVKMGAVDADSSTTTNDDHKAAEELSCPLPDPLIGHLFDRDASLTGLTYPNSCIGPCSTPPTTHPVANTTTAIVKPWVYDGFLLDLALDMGRRLYRAFDTRTGVPYGTVHLQSGVPAQETTIASLAGGGTLSLEMELLSRLTGQEEFGKAAKLAARALFLRRSPLDLLGKHIDVQHGHWTETLSGVGSNSDSFIEYLVKHSMLYPSDSDFWTMFMAVYNGVHNHSRAGEWYVDVDMSLGSRRGNSRRVLESLMAFYPGMQVLLGELVPAARSLNGFFIIRELLGFLPERFHFGTWKLENGRGAAKHPLRPELLESNYFMHLAAKDLARWRSNTTTTASSGWQWAADFSLQKLETVSRAKCGYASVADLSPQTSGQLEGREGVHYLDEMPSFFLSETVKYLYLTFDNDNMLHTDDDREWIFTTEAHPFHHVSKKSGKKDTRAAFTHEVESLKELLTNRLRPQYTGRKITRLEREKWSYETRIFAFEKQLSNVMESAKRIRAQAEGDDFFDERRLVEPVIPEELVDLTLAPDTQKNLAHLTMSDTGVGPGTLLRRACPNVYSSDLVWMHALNGGSMDYAEIYVSVAQDNRLEHPHGFIVLSPGEALGLLGTGMYMGITVDDGQSCPVADIEESPAGDAAADDPSVDDNAPDRQGVFELKTEFGNFEVSAYPEGDGFVVQHLESGETIVTTFLRDGDRDVTDFVMTYSAAPLVPTKIPEPERETQRTGQNRWRKMGSRFTSMFGGKQKQPAELYDSDAERNLIIADLEGNSFSCEVQVVEKYIDEHWNPDGKEDEEPEEVEKILARYPCAPALFGRTNVSRLVKDGGIEMEAVPLLPPFGDETGCDGAVDEEAQKDHPTVCDYDDPNDRCLSDIAQVLRRGECSFYSKSVNQRSRINADAVIIVNEAEELFVMSYGEEGELFVEPDDIPVTVLLTRSDGEDFLDKMTVDMDDDEIDVVVRISLSRQTNQMSSPAEDQLWPIVRGSSKVLQVYSKSGWGFQAGKKPTSGEWNLQLLKHDVGPV